MEIITTYFSDFFRNRIDNGNYASDNVIAFVMPLFEEVLNFHEADFVWPFEKKE